MTFWASEIKRFKQELHNTKHISYHTLNKFNKYNYVMLIND